MLEAAYGGMLSPDKRRSAWVASICLLGALGCGSSESEGSPPGCCGDAACEPPAPPPAGGSCDADQFEYVDVTCTIPDGGGSPQCVPAGDGKCYQKCTYPSDCNPCAPICHQLLLGFTGYVCPAAVFVCVPEGFQGSC